MPLASTTKVTGERSSATAANPLGHASPEMPGAIGKSASRSPPSASPTTAPHARRRHSPAPSPARKSPPAQSTPHSGVATTRSEVPATAVASADQAPTTAAP